mgnify:CR=1 FL=1
MRKTFFIAVIALVAGYKSLTATGKTQIFTITDKECQTIDGFGASDAWSMWQAARWSDSLRCQIADWLFSTETYANGSPKGIGLSIWRYNAGAGSATQGDSAKINRDTRTEFFQNQAGQRLFLKMAKERGVPVFIAFFNSPPINLTINGLATNTGRGGTLNLRDDAYADFARYAANMVETISREDGVDFNYLCPVNEPDGSWNWQGPKQEGTPATNREVTRIAREMDREFSSRNLHTQILINESSDFRCMLGIHDTDWQRGNEIQAFWNPDSTDTYVGQMGNVAKIMAGHSYWTNTPVLRPGERGYEQRGLYGYRRKISEAINAVGVKFWMTELCIMQNDEEIGGGFPYDFTMKTALYVARVMHYDLTVANACSWQWWRALGGNYRDGLLMGSRRGRGTEYKVRDSKLLWTIGNYSRFVRPGAVRLDVKGNDGDPYGVMASAYRNADGSLAIVVINYTNKEQDIQIGGIAKGKNLKVYRTSDTDDENLKLIGTANSDKITLSPHSVTTFVCDK